MPRRRKRRRKRSTRDNAFRLECEKLTAILLAMEREVDRLRDEVDRLKDAESRAFKRENRWRRRALDYSAYRMLTQVPMGG